MIKYSTQIIYVLILESNEFFWEGNFVVELSRDGGQYVYIEVGSDYFYQNLSEREIKSFDKNVLTGEVRCIG